MGRGASSTSCSSRVQAGLLFCMEKESQILWVPSPPDAKAMVKRLPGKGEKGGVGHNTN